MSAVAYAPKEIGDVRLRPFFEDCPRTTSLADTRPMNLSLQFFCTV